MVSLKDAQLSNARITSALPSQLVAVFVGATSGIGEYSLTAFAKYAKKPRIYIVGRSQEAADRIMTELKGLNSGGEYTFIKADISLINTVDEVCKDIKSKENSINLLFLSPGTMFMHKTPEGVKISIALAFHARIRFIENLLPLLQEASSLRRVVNVFAGTKEGNVDITNLEDKMSRGHFVSMMTLSLEILAKRAPDVSFIHNFPGAVMTNLIRGGEGALISTMAIVLRVIMPLFAISSEECGERHAFLATSARFPPGTYVNGHSGVPLVAGLKTARGTDGKAGSGVYSITSDGESADPTKEALLAKLRKEGVQDKVWKYVQDDFKRITESKK